LSQYENLTPEWDKIDMKFIADLHIHSKYSRATAKNLDFENLYYAAQIKGINVLGTGDFTYPAWISDIESKLEPAEPGLFSLKESIAKDIDKTIPEKCRNPVRFILQTEISNIYKKDERVRKNHNLVYWRPMIKALLFRHISGRPGFPCSVQNQDLTPWKSVLVH